jgi:hypothetical protein
VQLASPIFLIFLPEIRCGGNAASTYTLTNGVGKQGNYPPAAGASLDHGEQF